MTDVDDAPVIQLCFCPPMADPDDPEQHQFGCLHAVVLRMRAFWTRPSPFDRGEPGWDLRWARWNARYGPPVAPGVCYQASFGWVHVRPQCRCERKRR